MTVDSWLGYLIAVLSDNHRSCLCAETVLEAPQKIFPGVIILIKHRDLLVRPFLHQELRVDPRFALIAGLPAHGPGELLRLAPLCRARADEQMRHLLRVHVFANRRIARCSERTEDQQNFVSFDELAGLLYRLWRAVSVVIRNEIDLAAVDATFGIDFSEIGLFGLAYHAV